MAQLRILHDIENYRATAVSVQGALLDIELYDYEYMTEFLEDTVFGSAIESTFIFRKETSEKCMRVSSYPQSFLDKVLSKIERPAIESIMCAWVVEYDDAEAEG